MAERERDWTREPNPEWEALRKLGAAVRDLQQLGWSMERIQAWAKACESGALAARPDAAERTPTPSEERDA
jgi:hypothetical protein